MSEQTLALRLADEVGFTMDLDELRSWAFKAEDELRRLAVVEQERDQLRTQYIELQTQIADLIPADDSERANDPIIGRVERLVAERDKLRAEVEALRADAERYRWLRSQIESRTPAVDLVIAQHGSWGDLQSWGGDDPDRAIDAARKQEGGAA